MRVTLVVLAGILFPFLMTTLGSAVVFFFQRKMTEWMERVFLSFAAGIMIAASFWSLLSPAIEQAKEGALPSWMPVGIGFFLGGMFLLYFDCVLTRLPAVSMKKGHRSKRQSTVLITAVVLHNVPEGMAVGLSFAGAGRHQIAMSAAFALAFGIGIQNIPEGAAVSLPLRKDGSSVWKSFLLGALSGLVEPIFGIFTLFMVSNVEKVMPWLLSYAAGAMIYVATVELIPEAHSDADHLVEALGIVGGFLLMMILDVALG